MAEVLCFSEILSDSSVLKPLMDRVYSARTLHELVIAALHLARAIAVKIVEMELNRRGKESTQWPICPKCNARFKSKGLVKREMLSLIGLIEWKRRVGRCFTKGCGAKQVVPSDDKLGITPHQRTSNELKHVACALAVFVPFETAARLLEMLTTVWVSPTSIWNWIQEAGRKAMDHLEGELQNLAEGREPHQEIPKEGIGALPLIMGADGVMAPFRPEGGSPKGKAVWREVKVAIFARLAKRLNRKGKEISYLRQRRLVAVLGCKDQLGPRMLLEALRQGIRTARKVVWLSDGGRGFWAIFRERFARRAQGILDFYHAARNLWKGAQALFNGKTPEATDWFRLTRRRLRHGSPDDVLADIKNALDLRGLPEAAQTVLSNLYEYLAAHREHIDYTKFKELGLPIGSGLVESACKWLIQQRFKGVGMRWSEDGFNHLLHLRLAWVNARFDTIFLEDTFSPNC